MADPPEDDQVSLTSTLDSGHDSDQEFTIEDVLYEADGPWYLILWEGYPLAEASWVQSLKPEPKAEWTKKKQRIRRGFEKPFRVSEWKRAVMTAFREKQTRQRQRNALRRERNLPETETVDLSEKRTELETIIQDESDDDEWWKPPTQEKAEYQGRAAQPGQGPGAPKSSRIGFGKKPKAVDSSSTSVPSRTSFLETSKQPQTATFSSLPVPLRRTSTGITAAPGNSLNRSTQGPAFSAPSVFKSKHQPRKAPTPGFTGNVFSGGKERKTNPKLVDVASDKTKDPRTILPRHRWALQKQLRDGEGLRAPPLPKTQAREQGDSAKTQPLAVEESLFVEDSDMVNSPEDDNIMDLDDSMVPADHNEVSQADGARGDASGVQGPKTDEPNADGPNNVDRTTAVMPQVMSADQQSDPQPAKKVKKRVSFALDAYSLTRMARLFGKTRDVNLHLELTPITSFVPPFDDLTSPLDFDYVCSASNFAVQWRSLVQTPLATGSATNEGDDTCGPLAERLSIGSRGLFCLRKEYGILLFPATNHEWRAIDICQRAAETGLACVIIRPEPYLVNSLLEPTELTLHDQDWDGKLSPIGLARFGGVAYDTLRGRHSGPHDVFLAFPRSAEAEKLLVCWWLKRCNSECRISDTNVAGHWRFFRSQEGGSMIIHEDVAMATRRFPGMAKVLQTSSSKFNFWVLSRGLQSGSELPMGDLCLRQISQANTAILLMPSFLITEPERAQRLMQWQTGRGGSGMRQPVSFMTSAGILGFLTEVAVTKSEEIKNASMPPEEKRFLERLVVHRLELVHLIGDLVREDEEDVLDQSPIYPTTWISAPEMIDDHDEQSLLNYFGWWSLRKTEHFRRFYVLGANSSTRKRVHGVRFKNEEYEERLQPRQVHEEMVSCLEKCYNSGRTMLNCPIFVFLYPIGLTSELARDGPRDWEASKFRTFGDWIASPPLDPPLQRLNTYLGMFYSLADAGHFRPWLAFYRAMNPHKRPWVRGELLIWDFKLAEKLRHKQEIYSSDLLVAQQDLTAQVSQQSPRFIPSLPLERVLLGGFDHPQPQDSPWKGTRDYLSYIMRSWDNIKDELPAPASKMLERGWRKVLPPGPNVHPHPPGGTQHDGTQVEDGSSTARRERMELETEEPENAKAIFHPPTGKTDGLSTRCQNRLLQRAQEAQRKGAHDFDFEFEPATSRKHNDTWYGQQCKQGQGYEHIMVTDWEGLDQKLRIGKSAGF